MKIVVTGATGFVGKSLIDSLLKDGHEITILSRSIARAKKVMPKEVSVVEWDAPYGEIPHGTFTETQGVIHLMGENIGDKRWSDSQKKKLRDSRVLATQKIKTALDRDLNGEPLELLISTSAIGYYPVNIDTPLDENHSSGSTYLASLCQDWEQTAHTIKSNRTVIIRVGVVLAAGGGALGKLLPIFKSGLGGTVLPGSQVMSWIHRADLVNLYASAVREPSYQGTLNAVAPNPVTNNEFTKALGKAIGRPTLFPVPGFVLKIAMGEMSTIVLDSQLVVSTKLGNLGFKFTYPNIQEALQNI